MKYNKFSKLPKSCCIFYVKKQILTSCYKLVQGFRVPEKKWLFFIEEDILRNGNGNGNVKLFPLSLLQGNLVITIPKVMTQLQMLYSCWLDQGIAPPTIFCLASWFWHQPLPTVHCSSIFSNSPQIFLPPIQRKWTLSLPQRSSPYRTCVTMSYIHLLHTKWCQDRGQFYFAWVSTPKYIDGSRSVGRISCSLVIPIM